MRGNYQLLVNIGLTLATIVLVDCTLDYIVINRKDCFKVISLLRI